MCGEEGADPMTELLLHDLDHFGESLWRNEETGEKRFDFFLTLVTAVAGGLVTLATAEQTQEDFERLGVAPIALFAGYAAGRYYTGGTTSTGTAALGANTLYLLPFICLQKTTWTRMGVEIVGAFVRYSRGEDVSPQTLIPTKLYRKADGVNDPELK